MKSKATDFLQHLIHTDQSFRLLTLQRLRVLALFVCSDFQRLKIKDELQKKLDLS